MSYAMCHRVLFLDILDCILEFPVGFFFLYFFLYFCSFRSPPLVVLLASKHVSVDSKGILTPTRVSSVISYSRIEIGQISLVSRKKRFVPLD